MYRDNKYWFLSIRFYFTANTFNGAVDKLFEMYANEQRQKQVQQIQEQINEQYSPLWGYNVSGLEVIGNAALQNGLIVHVQTLKGELDWDISVHKTQECQLVLQSVS